MSTKNPTPPPPKKKKILPQTKQDTLIMPWVKITAMFNEAVETLFCQSLVLMF